MLAKPYGYELAVADPTSVRTALLELHRVLLQSQRIETERFAGRMSASEALQAAADDLRFSWLKTLSEPISALDEALAGGEGERAETALAAVRALIDPPDPDTAFGTRYLRALQESPDVVLAHRDATAALAA